MAAEAMWSLWRCQSQLGAGARTCPRNARRSLRAALGLTVILVSSAAGIGAMQATASQEPRAQLREIAEAPVAPALRLRDREGRERDLAELEGQVVLVNFWATWCPPCRREIPSLQRLSQRLGGQPFQVLAVNVGEDAQRIGGFLDALQVPASFPILLDRDSETAKAWRVRGLPTTWVVDVDMRLVYSVVGDADFDSPSVMEQLQGLITRSSLMSGTPLLDAHPHGSVDTPVRP